MSEAIRSIEAFRLPPDGGGAAKAFSRIGYELADALADLIDNSLDAEASRVEITFHRDDTRILAVTIADNGHGMTDRALREAMRFAVPAERRDDSLGVFGLGMKSASLSQCRSLTVLTRASGQVVGCRWSVESIKDHWSCEVLDPTGASASFEAAYFGGKGAPSAGTVVLWERLDRMSVAGGEQTLDAFIGQLMDGLGLKLGLVFHRFLGPKFGIVLRTKHRDRIYGLPRRIRPYDPFGYPKSGRTGYPKVFRARADPDGAHMALPVRLPRLPSGPPARHPASRILLLSERPPYSGWRLERRCSRRLGRRVVAGARRGRSSASGRRY